MKIKTFTASSIHAALMEARRLLGDEVVLLESVAANGDEPARITVTTDGKNRATTGGARATAVREQLVASRVHGRSGFGYHARNSNSDVAIAEEEPARASEGFSGGGGDDETRTIGRSDAVRGRMRDLIADDDVQPYPEPRRQSLSAPAGRGQVFPHRAGDAQGGSSGISSSSAESVEQLLKAQMGLFHSRLDRMERQFGSAIIGAAQTWMVNPLFGALLDLGFRPATVTGFFDALATSGFQPDADPETLKWALAQEIRNSIGSSAVREAYGAQIFIGPSGSGKTSLLLKLARHGGFYGRRKTAVLVVEPEDAERTFYQSPVDLFRRHGLPVQSVSTAEAMRKAVTRVQHFDHILIDTPALPLQPNAARKALRHLKRLVDPILPQRVQLVVNATRSLDDLNAEMIGNLPLRPDALALTHLDETPGWGRAAEWLIALNTPVQFLSTSAAVPDGVIAFSPSWFVEEMMKL